MNSKLVALAFFLASAALHSQKTNNLVQPNENLVTVNIPEISKDLAATVRKYTEARSAVLDDISPDGKSIIIGTRFGNTTQLHQVVQPMGARTQLTFFEEPVNFCSFEPTQGKYLVYSKDSGGNEFGQLYKLDLQTLESTLLTDGGRSQNGELVWRKDGKGFYFASTKRNGGDRDLYYMDMENQPTAKLVLEVKGGGWGISDISDDGKSLLVSEYISANESHIWMFDTATGKLSQVTDRKSKGVVNQEASFSSQTDLIWLITDKDNEFQRLATYNLKTRKYEFFTTSIPWGVDSFILSEDKFHIMFVTNEAGTNKMYKMDTADKKISPIAGIPVGLIGNMQFTRDAKSLYFSQATAKSSSDVYKIEFPSGKIRRWTQSELGGIQESDISNPELIEWTSFDKQKISGFYYPPASKFSGKRPVVIVIHGGPEGQSQAAFLGGNNYFTNEMGVALILPNVRGSSGYGKTFLQKDNGMFREDSVKDIGALLDWIAQQPGLDKDRIMIMGGSYGGYMTLATAFHYADKIRCSIDIVGISNYNTFLKNTEEYRRDLRRAEYGDERDPKMAAFFDKIAPLNNIDKIKKPLFIIQGTNDPRVPVSEAIQMRDKLQAAGNTVWYLEAKDEGHGFRKKQNIDYQRLATIRFMQEYLVN
ncbi:S9 family peptidase [Flavobacterium silvaticum]|uniref:S9 family peptidase n=1 Tax=Flavobacterium silvaticum TaxID=1852020 RepID=A0A972FWS4_9FLAO|nr:prolyl oligopeptidase family serine peptidase [Flavobacterium silvaticum]NMH29452.1 S9 family peptidase [Flavobacterium silvaticum]